MQLLNLRIDYLFLGRILFERVIEFEHFEIIEIGFLSQSYYEVTSSEVNARRSISHAYWIIVINIEDEHQTMVFYE